MKVRVLRIFFVFFMFLYVFIVQIETECDFYLKILTGNYEGGNEAIAEPIEISVVSLDSEMIIVQPAETNQADNESNANAIVPQIEEVEIRVDSSQESDVTPSRKRRKR